MAFEDITDLDAVQRAVRPSGTRANPVWSRDELVLALDLYMRRRSGFPSDRHPDVIELSQLLNQLAVVTLATGDHSFRNANGVAMKLQNFRRFDPSQQGKGLPGGGRGEEEVWKTFASDPKRLHAAADAIRLNVAKLPAPGVSSQDDIEEAEEGRLLTRLHQSRERDRKIVERRKAKELRDYGVLACEACGFDFAARYGDRGKGFIECHHTKAICDLRPGDKTRVDDLALLCANCHRMIHTRRPWMSIAELRKAMR